MYISGDPQGYASHMDALRWAVENTTGPIFEMGGGLFSTPYLFGTKRELVTHELNAAWQDSIINKVGHNQRHTWVTDPPKGHYSVAFIDGGRDESWLEDRREMFDAIDADIILVHDLFPHLFCEDWRPWYGADKRFKHQAWYQPEGQPLTWITSDRELPPGLDLSSPGLVLDERR